MLQFSWEQVSGPEVDLEFLENAGSTLGAIQGSALLQFLAPDDVEEETTFVFEVTVYDGLTSSEDLVTITLQPARDEVCDNDIDDDGDGAVDCVDTDCPACPEICDNGLDDVQRLFDLGASYEFELQKVLLRELDDDQLEQLSRQGQLYLTLVEMQTIQSFFQELGLDIIGNNTRIRFP